jgi:hypothetical protein
MAPKHQLFIGFCGRHTSCCHNERVHGERLIMKKIEAVFRRPELKRFFQCAERLGIFGFDLCENRKGTLTSEDVNQSRLTVDFAVSDADLKDTIHAVLEQAHPDSIAIFKFGPESPSTTGAGSGA